MGDKNMSYIKGRVQRYSNTEKEWLLIDTKHGKIVGRNKGKYPYVRVLRIIRSVR